MAGYKCPFCNETTPVNDLTVMRCLITFQGSEEFDEFDYNKFLSTPHDKISPEATIIKMYKCAACQKHGIKAFFYGEEVLGPVLPIVPRYISKPFPDYIPAHILEDYQEACSIKALSPKASATLSRRCLQSMIRDFWKIEDKTLYSEINQLEGKVSAAQWKVLHSLRELGNIGAHMKVNTDTIVEIEPEEAEKLILLIENLIEKWYINQHEEEALLDSINAAADEKKAKPTQ